MRSLFIRTNKLAYPAGRNIAVDPTHVAANNARMAAVCVGGANFVDALTGKSLTAVGASAGFNSKIGPYAVGTGTVHYNTFANPNTATLANITMAAILIPNTLASNEMLVQLDASVDTESLYLATGVPTLGNSSGVAVSSGLTALTAGVPYFVAVTVNIIAGKTSFVVTNLNTGVISTATNISGGGLGSSIGSTWCIGGSSISGSNGTSWIAAAMASGGYITPGGLSTWAKAPWDFWYSTAFERSFDDIVPFAETAQLAATEQHDTPAVSGTIIDHFSLAATEQHDTPAVSISVTDIASLAATEQHDTPAVSVTAADKFTLAATEQHDTPAVSVTAADKFTLAVTEQHDTPAVSATIKTYATLAATEQHDTPSISASVKTNIALAATEQHDTPAARLTVGLMTTVALAATEQHDLPSVNGAEHGNTWVYSTDRPRPYQGLHGV